MLQRLHIKNFALISEADIPFSSGLTTITGETGAGKSIMLGALGLVLGQRADMQMLTDKDSKCVVEAVFDIEQHALRDWFVQNELDFSDELIMRRELSPAGSSRAFINDTPVLLPQMRELGMKLIDIHSQHESLNLNTQKFQLSILDNLAGQQEIFLKYQKLFRQFTETKNAINATRENLAKIRLEKDYHDFLLNELEIARPEPGECQAAESELSVLENANEIKQSLMQAAFALDGNEQNILSELNALRSLFRSAQSHPEAKSLGERFEGIIIELKDIASEAENLGEKVVADPERQEFLAGRIDLLNQLFQKHRVNSEEDLIVIRDNLRQQTEQSESEEAKLKELEDQLANQQSSLLEIGLKLRKGRQKSSATLEKEVVRKLAMLGMPHARLIVRLEERTEAGEYGLDISSLLFTANKGMPEGELSKVASGGELSRVMFCIKSLTQGGSDSPVLIFDEIDTGVSGEVAGKLGSMMSEMSASHQMICITHLPQIASRGNRHLYVFKDNRSSRTVSNIREIAGSERIEEIARMLSGEKVTDAAMENARQLLTEAQ